MNHRMQRSLARRHGHTRPCRFMPDRHLKVWWKKSPRIGNLMVRRSVIALLAVGALVWVAEPSQAQFVLYDNFSTGVIDPAKWQGFVNEGTFAGPTEEAHRIADSGALRVRLVSWGDDATDTGSVRSGNGVNIVQLGTPGGSGFITGLK